jgi:hypothetical protein
MATRSFVERGAGSVSFLTIINHSALYMQGMEN